MRIGFIALTDAAPLIVAEARGLFAARGLDVELHREIGWATIRDKIVYGELDAAHAPAPMLWSAQLGLHSPACDVLTAFVLSRHGNALTFSESLWTAGIRTDTAFRELARERRRRQPLTLGVVFPFSSHHLWLRTWLRQAGLDPDDDVRIVVVPPAQVFRNLAAGTLDGFCAGEPWTSLAVRERIGWCRMCSAIEQPGHLEKVLMVTRRFAEQHEPEHARLLAALAEACAWCDDAANRSELTELLRGPRYLNVAADVIAPALTGRFDYGHGRVEQIADFHVFHRAEANVPAVSEAEHLEAALVAAGLVPAGDATLDLPRHLFRESLHRELLPPPAHHALIATSDLRGVAG